MVNTQILKDFAKKHGLTLELNGEAGFGIKCVGFIKDGKFLDYNPYTYPDKVIIKELYNDILDAIAPRSAYKKYNCMAVEGLGEESIQQLIRWVERLNILDVKVVEYPTGAKGKQAENTGIVGYALKI